MIDLLQSLAIILLAVGQIMSIRTCSSHHRSQNRLNEVVTRAIEALSPRRPL